MTTNLVISYPDIPFRSVYIRPTAAMATGFEAENCITGQRGYGFKFSATATTNSIDFDMGGSVTATADHVIIARPDTAGCNTITVRRGTDGSSWTTEYNDATFDATTLRFGQHSQDYIGAFTLSSAYRWWRVLFSHSSSVSFLMSKIYLGTFFDFGYDPDVWDIQQMPARESNFYSDSGAAYFSRNEYPIHRFSGEWLNVSDTIKQNWLNKVVRYHHKNMVYLYTRTNHEMLNSLRLVYCRLVDSRCEQVTSKQNCWRIRATFEEVLA